MSCQIKLDPHSAHLREQILPYRDNTTNNQRDRKRKHNSKIEKIIMSQCIVPSWNLRHQRQDLLVDQTPQEVNRSSPHVDLDSNHNLLHQPAGFSQVVPMSSFEVAELTWVNGQLAMHDLGAIFPPPPPTSTSTTPPKSGPTWDGNGGATAGDTLESIVHQATFCNNQSANLMPLPQNMENNVASVVASSGGKWAENTAHIHAPAGPPPPLGLVKKRTRSESENCANNRNKNNKNYDHESACASGNAAFCRDNITDTTMVTWASYDSPRSCTRTKTTTDEDSACHDGSENQEEERDTKAETGRSYTTRKGRAAAIHNQSERRRRDRINQKMKALQKLVPNASKTDKASMLDEVIEYLKQLQAQVQMMSNARFMPQFMMPLGMQQLQMSLLARMGMGAAGLGMGLGMIDTTSLSHAQAPPHQAIPQLIHPTQVSTTTSAFVPPAFVVPPMIPGAQQTASHPDSGASSSAATMNDPYSSLLAQSMNLDLYNRMAALQRQQQTQAQPTSNQLQSNQRVQ